MLRYVNSHIKKNEKNIIIVIRSITTILGFVFSIHQSNIAYANMQMAIENQKIAKDQKALAEKTMEMPKEAEIQALLEAERARIAEKGARAALKKVEEALERCK